jgi:hypothetical protein
MFSKNKSLNFPKREIIIEHVIKSLNIYFTNNSEKISKLPISPIENLKIRIPLKLIAIDIPSWGSEAGVGGKILVPEESLTTKNAKWTDVDWFSAAFLLLESCHERTWELQKHSIKSYSSRLKKWDTRAWDYAWVNRIGIFLSLWNDRDFELEELRKDYKLEISHDVDAISKTFQLRIKQSTFNFINALRRFDNLKNLRTDFTKNIKFIIKNADMNNILNVIKIEKKYGLNGTFNLYSKLAMRGPKSWLIDPSYTLQSIKKYNIPKIILENECKIGMHGSISSAKNLKRFITEKNKLEIDLGIKIESHRQHWLSLYWGKTFHIYDASHLQIDSTLMFNDKSGFRNSACIQWKPWNFRAQNQHMFTECPTLVMDSQIYDYAHSPEKGFERALRIIQEVKSVGGQGQILWHPHTLSSDYGWEEGFNHICSKLGTQ